MPSNFKTIQIDERLVDNVATKIINVMSNLLSVVEKGNKTYFFPATMMSKENLDYAADAFLDDDSQESRQLIQQLANDFQSQSDSSGAFEMGDDTEFIIQNPETGQEIPTRVLVRYNWQGLGQLISGKTTSFGARVSTNARRTHAEIRVMISPVMLSTDLINRIKSSLRHELVHLFDPNLGKGKKDAEYYQKDEEKLAYISQIEMDLDNLLKQLYQNLNQNNQLTMRFLKKTGAKNLLNYSPTWVKVGQKLDKESVKIVKQKIKQLYQNWQQNMQNPNIKMADLFGYSQPTGGVDISGLDY